MVKFHLEAVKQALANCDFNKDDLELGREVSQEAGITDDSDELLITIKVVSCKPKASEHKAQPASFARKNLDGRVVLASANAPERAFASLQDAGMELRNSAEFRQELGWL